MSPMLSQLWQRFRDHPYAAGLIIGAVLLALYLLFRSKAPVATGNAGSSALSSYYAAEAASIASGNDLAAQQSALNASVAISGQQEATKQLGFNLAAQTARTQSDAALSAAGLDTRLSWGRAMLQSMTQSTTDTFHTGNAFNAGGGGAAGSGGTGPASSQDTTHATTQTGPTVEATTNFKPWLSVVTDELFGSADPALVSGGSFSGPSGTTGSALLAKYFGWVGGAALGPRGNTVSWDLDPRNPVSPVYKLPKQPHVH